MMSFDQVRHNAENNDVAWQPRREHRSLKIFDVHSSLRSRIPVLVDKHNLNTSKANKLKIPDDPSSKIPVYKIGIREIEGKSPTVGEEKLREPRKKGRTHNNRKNTEVGFRTRKHLKLHGLELTVLPEDLFDRTELESLILSPERESCLDYKLPFLPSAVGRLVNLRTLVLDTNELHDIPDEIENLQMLETIVLGNNNLNQLPDGLAQLNRLKSLHLTNNRFEEMPSVICHLASLRFLDMSDNNLQCLPDEICQLAGTLTTLLLVMNQLEFLPESFSLLTSLSCLWLGENHLRELPEDFGELYRLDWGRQLCSSNIDGNPLERPPLHVCHKGPLEIRKYFHELKASSKHRNSSFSSSSSQRLSP